MKRKNRSDGRRNWLSLQTMELVRGGMQVMTRLGPVGWIAVVAIVAMMLAGYAIHAIMAVVTKA